MEKKQIIEAMHNRLHEIDPHAKAILFGSRARGTEHEGSDWDVLILLDKPILIYVLQKYEFSFLLSHRFYSFHYQISEHDGRFLLIPRCIL